MKIIGKKYHRNDKVGKTFVAYTVNDFKDFLQIIK